MHYIRILRPPALAPVNGASRNSLPSLNLVLTITTDLGDSFLCPDAPIDVVVELHIEAEVEVDEEEEGDNEDGGEREAGEPQKLESKTHTFQLKTAAVGTAKKNKPAQLANTAPAWTAGLRVLKLEAALPPQAAAFWNSDDEKRICIRAANADISATHARQIIYPADDGNGLIMPLWVDVPDAVIHSNEPFPHVALRRLDISPDEGNTAAIEVEEEIGESIARHVWDAGLVTVAFLADTCLGRLKAVTAATNSKKRPHDGDNNEDPHSKETHASILKKMLRPQPKDGDEGTLRILELGSGVGILGIGLAKILHEAVKAADPAVDHRGATVLLTDLPEAEERTRANMALVDFAPAESIRLEYANLDWLDGETGKFDSDVVSETAAPKPFDFVMLSDCTYNVDMLPALVGTLTSLQTATKQKTQRVLITKKTRHQSEELLFDLLKDAGWRMLAGGGHPIRLPVLDNDEQTIEVFIFERTI